MKTEKKPDLLDLLAEGASWEYLLTEGYINQQEYNAAVKQTIKEEKATKLKNPPIVEKKPFVAPIPVPQEIVFSYITMCCSFCCIKSRYLHQKMVVQKEGNTIHTLAFEEWTPELSALKEAGKVQARESTIMVEMCHICLGNS